MTKFIAPLIVSSLVVAPSLAWGQRPDQATIDAIRQSRLAQARDGQIAGSKRAYESFSARGNDKAAAQAAWSVASMYERQEDWVDAATWYRNSYSKGGLGGAKGFIDLMLQDKIAIDNPDSIRTLVETRAIDGSRIARNYVLAHWHETPTQIPEHPNACEKLTECGPVGLEDRMEPHVMNEARHQQTEQQWANYYRQHPNEDPKMKEQKAAEGLALVLSGVAIQAVNMPATGPGSIACNKHRNKYPDATDASVCNALPQK